MDEKKVRDAIETIKSNYPTSGYYMLCEALDAAIEALEKQLKMKPVKACEKECTYYVCPSCKNVLVSEYPNSGTYGEKRDCVMCNQKIDWLERPL